MGNHWGAGRDKEPAGACAAAVRALAATGVAATAFFALGLPGTSAQPVAPASPAGSVSLPGLAGGFLTDSRALVPFSRTIVTTVAKDGHAQLNVASAALKRPPEGSLMAPLEVLRPSSPFGYRISPLSGAAGDFHLGQDYAAACGTRVYSADAGVVRAAGWHPWGGGNRVEIDHGNGLITTYNHLEAIAVRAGDSVQVGQVIARVGTTGWSTGCHLHFETILDGKHTSPLNWTLLAIRQVDELKDLVMISYDGTGTGTDASAAQRWAIPVATDNSHAVLNGEAELSQAPEPAVPSPSTPRTDPPGEPSSDPTASPTATPTASPTASSTASPSPTSASPTATPSPTGTSTPSPTGTPDPSPTGTLTATPTTASPTPTPTPTGTSPTPVPTGNSPTPTATTPPSPSPTPLLTSPSLPTLTTLTTIAVPESPPTVTGSTTATPTATEPAP